MRPKQSLEPAQHSVVSFDEMQKLTHKVPGAYFCLVRSMPAPSLFIAFAVITPWQWVGAQGRVYVDDRLPAASIELRPGESPVTSSRWRLPKPGDPLYDARKEAEIYDR